MVLDIDSFELLLLKVLVSDEIAKLEQRIQIWREDVVVPDDEKKSIIEFNENQVGMACKLYHKLLKLEV